MQSDADFQALNIGFVSIAFDSAEEQAAAQVEYGITDVPLLIDAEGNVSRAYDVLKWAIANGEPGHTFILVNTDGTVSWIRDYGAPDLPDRTMYVPIPDLVSQIEAALQP